MKRKIWYAVGFFLPTLAIILWLFASKSRMDGRFFDRGQDLILSRSLDDHSMFHLAEIRDGEFFIYELNRFPPIRKLISKQFPRCDYVYMLEDNIWLAIKWKDDGDSQLILVRTGRQFQVIDELEIAGRIQILSFRRDSICFRSHWLSSDGYVKLDESLRFAGLEMSTRMRDDIHVANDVECLSMSRSVDNDTVILTVYGQLFRFGSDAWAGKSDALVAEGGFPGIPANHIIGNNIVSMSVGGNSDLRVAVTRFDTSEVVARKAVDLPFLPTLSAKEIDMIRGRVTSNFGMPYWIRLEGVEKAVLDTRYLFLWPPAIHAHQDGTIVVWTGHDLMLLSSRLDVIETKAIPGLNYYESAAIYFGDGPVCNQVAIALFRSGQDPECHGFFTIGPTGFE